jgi:cytochrome c peroxidase
MRAVRDRGGKSWAVSLTSVYGVAVCLVSWVTAGCGKWSDQLACGQDDCTFTDREWSEIGKLSPKTWPEPPCDCSNKALPFNRPGNAQQESCWDSQGACRESAEAPRPAQFEPDKDEAVQFGWALYYDPRLSGPATWVDTLGRPTVSARAALKDPVNISCATCHDPARAGSDYTSLPGHVSVGAGWYDVNIQQTLNAAYFPLLYWNGRADSLWAQAAQVMESGVSMNGSREQTACVVANFEDSEKRYLERYESLFGDYPKELDYLKGGDCSRKRLDDLDNMMQPHGPTEAQKSAMKMVHANAAMAIGAYEWYLRSRDSAFDTFVQEGPGSSAIPAAAKRGLKLFVGRASCVDCHGGPLLSDRKFHDIGIAQTGQNVPTIEDCAGPPGGKCSCVNDEKAETCLPWGAYAGLQKLAGPNTTFRRNSDFSAWKAPVCVEQNGLAPGAQPSPAAGEKQDGGASEAPNAGTDTWVCSNRPPTNRSFKGRWRTPSLRDVALTAPYMHNGSLATLEDVVWHYDQGVSAALPEAPVPVLCGAGASFSTESDAGRAAATGEFSAGAPAPELHPLRLSAQDRADIVAFLRTLTGKPLYPKLHTCPPFAGVSCATNAVTTAGPPPGNVAPSLCPASTDAAVDAVDAGAAPDVGARDEGPSDSQPGDADEAASQGPDGSAD